VAVFRYTDGSLQSLDSAGGWLGTTWFAEEKGQVLIKVSARLNTYNAYLPVELFCKPCARPFRSRTFGWKDGKLNLLAEETTRLAYELYHPRKFEEPLPEAAMAARRKGEELMAAGKPAEAVAPLTQAVAAASEYPDALSDLSYAYALLGRWAESRAAAQTAVVLNPWHAHAEYNLGVALLALGQFKEAEQPLRVATGLQVDRWEPHYQLGLCYEKQQNVAAAADEYKQALALKPEDPTIQQALGRIK
jgi:Flp pilus assembly protein TadD